MVARYSSMARSVTLRWMPRLIFLILLNFISELVMEKVVADLSESEKLLDINRKLLDLINLTLEQENQRVENLKRLQSLTLYTLNSVRELKRSESSEDLHPIDSFVLLHRSIQNLMTAQDLTDTSDEDFHGYSLIQKLEDMLGSNETGLENHLLRRGEALLRYQRFYNLDVEVIVRGDLNMSSNSTTASTKLNVEDCFLLGRIAYNNRQFDLSVNWLKIALRDTNCSVLSLDASACSSDDIEDVTLILDYLAYAAYRNGDIESARNFTEIWLQYEPSNERALDNLVSYGEELGLDLGKLQSGDTDKYGADSNASRSRETDLPQPEDELQNYDPGEDSYIRSICRKKSSVNPSQGYCFTRSSIHTNSLYPQIRYEVLNLNPEIVRAYDAISKKEAYKLYNLALPQLRPSTTGVDNKGRVSKFRVAQTAWLEASEHPLVASIEQRLFHFFGLSFDSPCEPLQVVNYKFGGHYGPHYDSSRVETTEPGTLYEQDGDDRAATVLIYLNHVGEGGMTVFPKLNLTVEPVEGSAVVWFNIDDHGFTDSRLSHAACPVFDGPKWIATKWPRVKLLQYSEMCKTSLSKSRFRFAPFRTK